VRYQNSDIGEYGDLKDVDTSTEPKVPFVVQASSYFQLPWSFQLTASLNTAAEPGSMAESLFSNCTA
jgi:hypothetical protein